MDMTTIQKATSDNNETVRLWTRQMPQVLQSLQDEGVYTVKQEYIERKNDTIAPFYLSLYRWYTQQARQFMEIREELEYPIWFSVEEEFQLQPTQDTVILEVEIPRDRVLFCNMSAWDYRVNYWYIPENEADAQKHRAELKKYGLASDDELFLTDKGNFYPLLKRKVEDSWKRVFSLSEATGQKSVATAWELRREWVKKVIKPD